MIAMTFCIMGAMAIVMSVGWVFQRAVHDGGWTDVFWTFGTGLSCAAAALVPLPGYGNVLWRQLLVAILVLTWAIRLGTYIVLRVSKGAEDVRYAALRQDWGARFQTKMFGVMLVQAPVTALLGISVLYAAHRPAAAFRLNDLVGVAILAVAVAGEAIADRQMQNFRSDPAAKGAVCDRGLWAWSRHPNYFFEILGWLAYPVIGVDAAHPASLAAFTAPLLMFIVIRYGTGIPPLEEAMLRSKGDAYRDYQRRVAALVPWPPRH